uniref:Methyltransf_30 domain-containing protein n=1 Tax=Steinernema glaseri TaxID=37863 RepID=A0A1I7XYX3_9BILA
MVCPSVGGGDLNSRFAKPALDWEPVFWRPGRPGVRIRNAADLAILYARLPEELQPQAQELLAAWPMLVPGIHRLELDEGRVTLTLAFGQAETMMRELQCHADAFYLDGFAPRGNPSMWSRSVLGQLVRLAAPGATAASWCCAGQVRRDLASQALERLALDQDWVQWLDREQGSALAGVPLQGGGLYFPQGMVVDPGALVACLLNHPLIECLPEHVSLQAGQEPGLWDVCNQRGECLESSNRVVIAAAAESLNLLPDELLAQHPMPRLAAMQRLAGQVTYLPAEYALTRGEVTLS